MSVRTSFTGKNSAMDFVAGLRIDRSTATPRAIADAVVDLRKAAVAADVRSHACLADGLEALADNDEQLAELFQFLKEHKFLSVQDERLGFAGESRLSMMKKVKQYEKLLLDPRIHPLLKPGLSVLYQIARIFETLEKKHGRR